MEAILCSAGLRYAVLRSQHPNFHCIACLSIRHATQLAKYVENQRSQLPAILNLPTDLRLSRFSRYDLMVVPVPAKICKSLAEKHSNCSECSASNLQFFDAHYGAVKFGVISSTPSSRVDVFKESNISSLYVISPTQIAFGRPLFMDANVTSSAKRIDIDRQVLQKATFEPGKSKRTGRSRGPASGEQLFEVKEKLERYVPWMLHSGLPYRLFDQHVIIEDCFTGKPRTRRGVNALAYTVAKYRFLASAKCSHARVHVLHVQVNESQSRLIVRWRIVGLSHSQLLKQMVLPKSIRRTGERDSGYSKSQNMPPVSNPRLRNINSDALWIDGYFDCYVNSSGQIGMLRIDRVDHDRTDAYALQENSLIAKLLAALGLVPKPQQLYEGLLATQRLLTTLPIVAQYGYVKNDSFASPDPEDRH